MKLMVALIVSAAILFTGCASYTPRAAPLPTVEAMPSRQVESNLVVGADAYVDRDRQKEVFDKALTDSRILPILVFLQSRTDEAIHVSHFNIKLILPDNTHLNPVTAGYVASLFAPSYQTYERVGLAFGPLGSVGALAAGINATKAQQLREEDYARKELKETWLKNNESTHGFVFFALPAETAAFNEATLAVSVLNVYGMPGPTIHLPVKGLKVQ